MRQLWQCHNVHIKLKKFKMSDSEVYCTEGHDLLPNGKKVRYRQVMRGDALEFQACQGCPDISLPNDRDGFPCLNDGRLEKEERGWV